MILHFVHLNLSCPCSSGPGLSPLGKLVNLHLLVLVVIVEEEQLLLLFRQLARYISKLFLLGLLEEQLVLVLKLGLTFSVPQSEILGVGLEQRKDKYSGDPNTLCKWFGF